MNPVDKPNVLWVFADQMRGMAMSCATPQHGPHCNVHTPNLDRLAADGTRFTTACSTYPVCVPFRFSLITGQYAHSRVVPTIHYRMSPAERTIAHEFNDAGYHTAYFGKWHLDGGPMGTPGGPRLIPQQRRGGFREWHAFELRNSYYDTWIQHDDEEPARHEGFQTDILFELLRDWLRERDEQPFFGVLSFEAPHPPMEVPNENLQREAGRTLFRRPNVPEPGGKPFDDSQHFWGQSWEKELEEMAWEAHARHYYAMVENADDNLGRLMETLETTGLAENTIVMFFADHGELLGSHHLFTKSSPYEESINIPFIVRGPGIQAGQLRTFPICTEDIFPTTLGLAGLTPQVPCPGLDITTFLQNTGGNPEREDVYLELVDEYRQSSDRLIRVPWRALRSERYLFAATPLRPWMLFDMQEDPYQMNNLVDTPEHASLLEQMVHRLAQRVKETEDIFPFTPEKALDTARKRPVWNIPWMIPAT